MKEKGRKKKILINSFIFLSSTFQVTEVVTTTIFFNFTSHVFVSTENTQRSQHSLSIFTGSVRFGYSHDNFSLIVSCNFSSLSKHILRQIVFPLMLYIFFSSYQILHASTLTVGKRLRKISDGRDITCLVENSSLKLLNKKKKRRERNKTIKRYFTKKFPQ